MPRYNVSLPCSIEQDLCELADALKLDKGEVFTRALLLLKHAVNAHEVHLVYADNTIQKVIVK